MPDKQVTIKVVTDSSQATTGLQKTSTEAANLEKAIATHGGGITGTLSVVSQEFGRLGQSAGLSGGVIGQAVEGIASKFRVASQAPALLGNAEEAAAAQGVSSSAVMAGAVVAGAAIAGAAILKFAEDGVKNYLALGEAVHQFQEVSGASAEESSKLIAISNDLGVSTDTTSRAMYNLGKTIEGHPDKLRAVGVAVAYTKQGQADLVGTLGNVAEAYQKAGAGAEGDAIASAAFGKAGLGLLPILNQSKESLNQMAQAAQNSGRVLTEDQVQATFQARVAMQEFKDSIQGAGISLGKDILPFMTAYAQTMSSMIDSTLSFIQTLGGFGGVIKGAFRELTNSFGSAASNLFGVEKAGHAAAGGLQHTAAVAEISAQNLQADAQQAESLQATLMKVVNAQDSFESANRAVTSAEQQAASAARSVEQARLAEAQAVHGVESANLAATQASQAVAKAEEKQAADQDKLNDLLAKGVINTRAVDTAQKQLETSTRSVTSAQNALEKANEAVATAQQKEAAAQAALQAVMAGPSAADRASAEEAVGRATNNAAEAALRLKATQAATAATLADSTATDDQKRQAQIDLSNAQYNVVDANKAQAEAQQKLTDVTNEANPSSTAYKNAQQALHTAQEDLTDAINNQTDAQQRLVDANDAQIAATQALQAAQAPDQALIDGIAQAQQTLANDTDNVSNAQQRAKDAADAAIDAHQRLKDSTAAVGDAEARAADSTQAIADARHRAAQAAFDLADATGKESAALQSESDAVKGALAQSLLEIAQNNPAADLIVNQLLGMLGLTASQIAILTGGAAGPLQKNPFAHHGGGPITMQGGMAPDEVPAILQLGEYVINRQAAAEIGPGALAALNAYGRGAMPPVRAAGGGGSGRGGAVTVNVYVTNQGSLLAERDLIAKIRSALLEAQRNLVTNGFR